MVTIAVAAGMVAVVLSSSYRPHRLVPAVATAAGVAAVDGPAVVVAVAAGSRTAAGTALAWEAFARNWDAAEVPFGKVVSRRNFDG